MDIYDLENKMPDDNESCEKADMFQICAERLMKELNLKIDRDEPEYPDTVSYTVPMEIESGVGSAIIVLDFVYDLAGKGFDPEVHDNNPFMDGETMKAMMRGLPEQELSIMVRSLKDPVLRSLAVDALVEKARRASVAWQKRMHRKTSAKFRSRERRKQ